jgi:plasmid replication initiation protein
MFVGATPQVLTFAALTRNFDIQNEIEVKDDLDNKPDNEEIENFAKDVPNLFEQLLKEIKEEVKSGKRTSLQTDVYVDEVFTKSQIAVPAVLPGMFPIKT